MRVLVLRVLLVLLVLHVRHVLRVLRVRRALLAPLALLALLALLAPLAPLVAHEKDGSAHPLCTFLLLLLLGLPCSSTRGTPHPTLAVVHLVQVLGWVSQLVLAIGYVHSLGVVFRDLKLENLLLDGG